MFPLPINIVRRLTEFPTLVPDEGLMSCKYDVDNGCSRCVRCTTQGDLNRTALDPV